MVINFFNYQLIKNLDIVWQFTVFCKCSDKLKYHKIHLHKNIINQISIDRQIIIAIVKMNISEIINIDTSIESC